IAQYPDGGHAAIVFRSHPELADSIVTWFRAMFDERLDALPVTNGMPLASPVVDTLRAIDRPGGAADALARGNGDGGDATAGSKLPEYFVNQLGYEHMLIKDYGTAIDLMKLNAALYPASPNTMDSLGDVYLASGDRAAALAAARKTLELLAADTTDRPER